MPLELFGKTFKSAFLFLVFVELLSLLAHLVPSANAALFFILMAAALTMTLIKLEYGLSLVLAELFVGGKGHLFTIDFDGISLSIRISLFLVIIAVWLVQKIKTRQLPAVKKLIPFYLLLAAITIGLVNGWYHNSAAKMFFDFNAWIYFALAPVILDILKDKKVTENLLQILTAATTYLALKTIGILILFASHITGMGGIFYQWVRNSGVGEITYMSGTIFRVFLQSQMYLMIGFFIILFLFLASQNKGSTKVAVATGLYLYLVSFALMISQSRSYWVGMLVGTAALLALAFHYLKLDIKKLGLTLLILASFIWSQTFLLQLITFNFAGNIVSQRFANLEAEAAGLSRLNQLQPLSNAILQQPIFGYGFGKELTYISTDPRIVKQHPDGVYTTYAFEWGYLDIWLKLGLFGLVSYIVLIYFITRDIIKNPQPLQLGMLLGLIALLATNIFSPYLNHPLGIGYILLLAAAVKN